MGLEGLPLAMENHMLAFMKMTKSMAMVFLSGRTTSAMRGGGTAAPSMGWVY